MIRAFLKYYLIISCCLFISGMPLHAQMASLKAGIEMDTPAVKRYLSALNKQLLSSPADSTMARRAMLAKKYLQACAYYEGGGWSWATKSTGLNFTKRLYAAAASLKEITGDAGNPLRDRSLYLLGRIYYWLDLEDNELYTDTLSSGYFKEVAAKYPLHQVLRMYRGEKIPAMLPAMPSAGAAPRWAVYQREAMERMLKLIHWWVREKQATNGEMGGKYGDDVELLRWWLPAILGADDSTAAWGYTRLADGVWNSDALDKGYAKRVDDVEHSAELFRDTHPGMFMIKYGDPEYVERCMISMQHFTSLWTGITPRGHRHFRSYYLSSSEVREGEPDGVDVPLNARALLPGLWVAWYNRHPAILKPFSEWCRSWIEDAARTDNDKPAGVFPAAVTFTSDKIGGYTGTWYDANLAYNYYRWESIGHVSELYAHMTGMYGITHDPVYLQPVNAAVQLIRADAHADTINRSKPGTVDWVGHKLAGEPAEWATWGHPMAKVLSMTRKLTGTTDYDSLVMAYGQPYNRYSVTGNRQEILDGFPALLNALKYNFPMMTSEVKFTDRVYVPGSNLLMGMYTGHFGAGFEYPSLVADWKNTGKEVAVFVHKGTAKSALVSLFNFGAAKNVTMRTWQLEPGTYRIREGFDDNDDEQMDALLRERTIVLTERVNPVMIRVPSKRTFLVLIEQLKADSGASLQLSDPAVNARDIKVSVSKGVAKVSALVHNIGIAASGSVLVELRMDGRKMDSVRIGSIEAPGDLVPCMQEVALTCKAIPGRHQLEIKIVPGIKEITSLNNEAKVLITLK